MKKDILLIANYWHFDFEKKSSRYRSVADILCGSGFHVEVITSSFRHQTKMQRSAAHMEGREYPYKVTLLREPGYKKNISLTRIYSHHCFAREVLRYLKNRSKPELIIVSVPSLSVGSAVTKYANRHRIKVIVDIQDLWPEAFKMAVDIPLLSDILFAPMMLQANRIYARADKIMAVSQTYVQRGLACNRKDRDGLAVYIGTDSEMVLEATAGKTVPKKDDWFWIGYIGALGHSYDIKLVIDAIHILNEKGIHKMVLKIMGEGVLQKEFKRYAEEKRVACDFLGFMEYGDMMATLKTCDVAVNPITGRSVSSIINKVSDYAMAGIPVVNTQNSLEYRTLVSDYGCGINCENGDARSVADALELLYHNRDIRVQMGKNAEKLAKEKFDRTVTYKNIVSLVERM